MAPWGPMWTTSLAGSDSTLPLEPLLLPNPLPHQLLLLHPTDRQRPRLHRATPTISMLNPYNLHSRSNPYNLPSINNPPIFTTPTPTPAESARTAPGRLNRTHINLQSPLSTSHLSNRTLLSTRCRLASVSDRLRKLPVRNYHHCLEDNSTVVPTMLLCRPHRNARMLAAGMTPHQSRISVLRVGMSTNRLRLLHLSQTRWDPLVLRLVQRRPSIRARLHHFLLHPDQAV